jgi:hypothetical protein
MAQAAPFVFTIRLILDVAIFLATLVVALWAFVHCLLQRSDAFPAIGTIPKGAWLAIIGVATVLAALMYPGFGFVNIFGLIAVAAACIYLLDVRPALRDATGGGGSW